MKVRTLLILTAIVSSLLGATAGYLALSVPNDLRADAMLKEARKHIADGDEDKARASLSHIVQQYPRTDAAAAATVALVSIQTSEREKLERELAALRAQSQQQAQVLAQLQQGVTEIKNAPPKVITVQAPPPKPPPKRAAPKKRTTRKRR